MNYASKIFNVLKGRYFTCAYIQLADILSILGSKKYYVHKCPDVAKINPNGYHSCEDNCKYTYQIWDE